LLAASPPKSRGRSGVGSAGGRDGLLVAGRGGKSVLAELIIALVGYDRSGELSGGEVVVKLGMVKVVGGSILLTRVTVRSVTIGRRLRGGGGTARS